MATYYLGIDSTYNRKPISDELTEKEIFETVEALRNLCPNSSFQVLKQYKDGEYQEIDITEWGGERILKGGTIPTPPSAKWVSNSDL